MIEFTTSEIKTYYETRVPSLRFVNNREWRGPCPVHDGKDLNFAVDGETGLANCHSQCGRGWDIISLEQDLNACDFASAKESVFQIIGRPNIPWEERNLEVAYDYTDESGRLLYQVLRFQGKQFKQRRPNGSGWTWGLGDVTRVPYRLPKVVASPFVAVVEGEKDVHSLEHVGMVATCNNGGAGNFKPELAKWFKGKKVAIFPDNDDPGREHAIKVAVALHTVALEIRVVELPNLPVKGDVTDFLRAGGNREQIFDLCRKSQVWTPEWSFSSDVPCESDRYIRTVSQEIELSGGLAEYWNLTRQSGLLTPWDRLSRTMGGGLRDGEMYVLGGNQGSGKTSLALQFAISALRRRKGVLMFSLEMGWKAVFHRMAAIHARVDLNELQDRQMRKEDVSHMIEPLQAVTREMERYALYVCNRSSVTPEYIIEETSRIKKKQPLHLVIVDHMQLMSSTGTSRSDYEKFTAISRAMKQAAVDVNVPVLVVSQTSRNNSKEHRHELEVSDLRGSGAIEEDAAGVLLVYEDGEDKDRTLADNTYASGPVRNWLKIGKNRYGVQGAYMPLLHFKTFTRFDLPEDVDQ